MPELQSALRARGMHIHSNSKVLLKQKLNEWLDLSITHSLPTSILILSRAFLITERSITDQALMEAISSLPDELLEEVKLKLDDDLGKATVEQKLEVVQHQNLRIAEEAKAEAKEKVEKQKVEKQKAEKPKKEAEKPISVEKITEDTLKDISEAVSTLATDSGVPPLAIQTGIGS